VKIPARLQRSIEDAIAHHLATELGDRGLLLTAGDLAVAEAETAALGERLLTRVLEQCYPVIDGLTVEFEGGGDVARIGGALAFGAVTATVLASGHTEGLTGAAELLCATFNLAIGLVDGVCDGDVETGERLLNHLQGADVIGAATDCRGPGWLREGLPLSLAANPSVAFTVDIIEAFFDTLHRVYSDEAVTHVRRIVGDQLALALATEAQSVGRSLIGSSHERAIECSRGTSVLPFEIIETLSTGARTSEAPTAGTLLGEAMWRVDDLVDLCDDARFGALNGVLVAASNHRRVDGSERYQLPDLERLLATSDIASVAARAAECLREGLRLAGGVTGREQNAFLQFIQRYAGIPAPPTS
jgi:hypothetical protein